MSLDEYSELIECIECGGAVKCVGDDTFRCTNCFAEFSEEDFE